MSPLLSPTRERFRRNGAGRHCRRTRCCLAVTHHACAGSTPRLRSPSTASWLTIVCRFALALLLGPSEFARSKSTPYDSHCAMRPSAVMATAMTNTMVASTDVYEDAPLIAYVRRRSKPRLPHRRLPQRRRRPPPIHTRPSPSRRPTPIHTRPSPSRRPPPIHTRPSPSRRPPARTCNPRAPLHAHH